MDEQPDMGRKGHTMNETLYLELEETNLPEGSTVGVTLRVPVESAEAAPALRDELVTRFFSGLQFTARLHVHRTDGPCEVQDL